MSNVDLTKVSSDGRNKPETYESRAAKAAFERGGSPKTQIEAARAVGGRNLQYNSHFGNRQQQRAWDRILKKHAQTVFPHIEETCPGHVAWEHSSKFCGNCGIHVESMR